jgi:hypothetical protein
LKKKKMVFRPNFCVNDSLIKWRAGHWGWGRPGSVNQVQENRKRLRIEWQGVIAGESIGMSGKDYRKNRRDFKKTSYYNRL